MATMVKQETLKDYSDSPHSTAPFFLKNMMQHWWVKHKHPGKFLSLNMTFTGLCFHSITFTAQ
jgi:hypothetical protein